MGDKKTARSTQASEQRIFLINGIVARMNMAFSAGRDIDKEKLIAVCIEDLGLSRRTALEYITTAKAKTDAAENNGVIVCNKKTNPNKKIDIYI